MRVSDVELFIHCKKVFQACGITYGCADDGAWIVTWSEFVGLNGMQALKKEVPNMQHLGIKSVDFVREENDLFQFEGNGQSAIILGKLMADYALAMAETKETVRIYMQNTTRSHLLAQPAYYVASQGKGCLIHYKIANGSSMWILATPEIAYPIYAEGAAVEKILERNLTAELGQYETKDMEDDDFWLVCTTETQFISSCIRNLREEAKNGKIELTESVRLKAMFDYAYFNGALIDDTLWNDLDQVGRATLVEASEQSRLQGTGEKAE